MLYASHNVFHGTTQAGTQAFAIMEAIARRHNYELREYLAGEKKGDDTETLDEKRLERVIRAEITRMNGINFINGANVVLTGSMHSQEKEYLKQKGAETVVVPLGKVSPGAGLRCIYGEFNLPN